MEFFIGLGSNLGDRGKNIQEALVLLERWGIKILRSSSLYETEPVGYKDQPWFYNMAALAEIVPQKGNEKQDFSPQHLVKIFRNIEQALGRERSSEETIKNGPRTIDLDLLFYDDVVLGIPGLIVPHPRLHERKFVLLPLNEIAPDFIHPVLKKAIKELLNDCKDESIVRPL